MVHSKKSGFTIIELIVVIAILGILALFLVPSFLSYAKEAQSAICHANMHSITREYETAAVHKAPTSMEEAKQLLAKIYHEHHAESSSGNTFDNGGAYQGICNKSGVYTNQISSDYTVLSIQCSVHGDGVIEIKELKKQLEAIDFSDIENFRYPNLNAYFNNENRTSIDSEAISTDPSAYGQYGSLAKAIDAKLLAQGINTMNRSWRMYKKDQTYNLFLTDHKITVDDQGSWVTCTKYDIENDQVIYGKIQVIIKDNYPILNGSSFTTQK